jgi:hypothetical protein
MPRKLRKRTDKDRARDRERYLEKRDEILAYQKTYRDTHKEEIAERRRQRDFIKKYMRGPRTKKTRKELSHDYYIRHRDEILAKQKIRDERRKLQQQYTGTAIT